MGPLSDQVPLADIAALTGGRYYYAPGIDELREVYNFIRGNVTSTGVIVNTTTTASSSRVPATVDCGAEQVMLACQWHDPMLRRTDHPPMRHDEIRVRLRTPAGTIVPGAASWISRIDGDGYVIGDSCYTRDGIGFAYEYTNGYTGYSYSDVMVYYFPSYGAWYPIAYSDFYPDKDGLWTFYYTSSSWYYYFNYCDWQYYYG